MQYKITSLVVNKLRNVLEAVFEAEFDNNVVKISGENGQGKSTVVDAIFLAIKGKTYIGRGRDIENLITTGQERATIEVTLESSQRTLQITRKITDKGVVTLDVIASDGSKLLQKDLDELLSEYSIDPLEFTRKSKAEQYEIVRKMNGVDTSEVDYQIQIQEKKAQDQRAITNAKRGAVIDYGIKPAAERVETSVLIQEMQGLKKTIDEYNMKKDVIETNTAAAQNVFDRITSIDQQIARLEDEKRKAQKEYDSLCVTIKNDSESQSELKEEYVAAKSKYDELLEKSKDVDAQNKKALEYEKSLQLLKERDEADKQLKEEEDKLEQLRKTRKKMIESGEMPVEGLGFSETEGVTINGLPIDQLSSAQQLVLACKIATSQNPYMKLIYIKDGSLLDANSMEMVKKIAEENDYQIIIERVGEEYDGIVMRDGFKIHP